MAFSFRAGTNWCHDFPKLAKESGFHFNMHRRRVRVDWNRISSIDIDRVIGERDFSTIDENVNNVVDYCLESEYDVKILDPNFVKLFRLAQLAVEYLLYCKQYLDHSVVILKDELKSKLEENVVLNNQQNASEKIIKELKDKLKERSRAIETKLSDSHGEIHKCPQCPKTFISDLFMRAHVSRRHPQLSRSTTNSPVHKQYIAETEKLHSEIKTLKERLNLTERVIRNESDKLLSTDSIVSNDNRETRSNEKVEVRNHRSQDRFNEEQHKRYQEEIDNLKTTLFDEIRNLMLVKKYPKGRPDIDDSNNGNTRDIIREQENEIIQLRQQISAKQPTLSIENVETQRDNQESSWQSKIDYLEARHTADIEKLYTQLRITRESADQMRVDYLTKLSDLERREVSVESNLMQARNLSYERSLSPTPLRDNLRDRMNNDIYDTTENVSIPIELQQNSYYVRGKERSRGIKSDYVSDEATHAYHTDDSIRNVERLKVIDSKERGKKTTKISPSGVTFSKRDCRVSKQDEVAPVDIISEDGRKNRKRWKIGRTDDTSTREDFHKILSNGTYTGHRSSASYTAIEKERPITSNSGNHSRGKILDTNDLRKEVPKGNEIKQQTSQIGDIIPNSNRRKYRNPVQDSRETRSAVENDKDSGVKDARATRANPERKESSSESEVSDSWLESESLDNSTGSETEDNSEPETSRRSPEPKSRAKHVEEKLVNCADSSEDMLEVFCLKLRDLGIDPEWRGIPNATFVQVMQIVNHHRNINSKKYRKFDEIRRKLINQLARRLTSKEKEDKANYPHEQSQLEKLVTNVKSKVSKSRNINKRDDGFYGANRPISTPSNSIKVVQKEVRPMKLQYSKESISSEESAERDTRKSERTLTYEQYGPVARRKQAEKILESTSDVKRASHSYESIKDFLKDTTNNRIQQSSTYNASGTLVTSTPQRNDEISRVETTSIANDLPVVRTVTEQNSLIGLSGSSPKNNKSVLKTNNGGSAGSLVKKKVLFDLESTDKSPTREVKPSMYSMLERKSNDREGKDSSESDFEISSIYEEKDQADGKTDDSPQSGKVVLLKTSQSEKIAEISKQIELQLSIARRKPVGAVEAMFMEKFSLGNDNELPINNRNATTTRVVVEPPTDTKLPQSVPTSWQNRNSRASGVRQSNTVTKDTNLDMDIDELLQME